MDKNKLANEYASNCNVSWATKEWEHDVKTFLAGFDAAMTELSKSGEFREFWIRWFENWNDRTHVITDVMTEKSKHGEDIHVIDIRALAAANAKLAEKDAKIQELEKELKLERMRGDHNSYCPNHQETKGLIVTEEFKANGVVVDCQFYKCPECEMTWLSGRQEHDVDMKIKNALEAKITGLEQQLKKAESVIGFYANEQIYGQIIKGDSVEIRLNQSDVEHGNINFWTGGKRARQYLKSRGGGRR